MISAMICHEALCQGPADLPGSTDFRNVNMGVKHRRVVDVERGRQAGWNTGSTKVNCRNHNVDRQRKWSRSRELP